jgi:transposase
MAKQKRYDKEFKLDAIELFEKSGKKISHIESDLGISRGNLKRWINDKALNADSCFPGKGNVSKENYELVKLRKENKILKEERDILKKVVSIFS